MRRTVLFVLTLLTAVITTAQRIGRIENVTEYDHSVKGGRVLKSIGSASTAPLPSKGSPKVPVILVQFADLKFSIADTDAAVVENYELFFNGGEGVRPGQVGHESYCSVREYYNLQSAGQFTPEFTIIGPVTLSESYKYYGENSGSSNDIRINAFYSEACSLAVRDFSVDWSIFDNKGNGSVSLVFFLYAGVGENSSDDTYAIWPKESASSKTITYGDASVTFGAFGATCELYQSWQDGIGPIVHELGHGLGLPDFYDTNYQAFGMDIWDVMDSGCYQMLGAHPCNMSAYEREFMGWSSIVPLNADSACTIVLEPLSSHGTAYKIVNKANSNEFLILENRQNEGLDAYFGNLSQHYADTYGRNHGLMVSHVDFLASAWNNNRVNTTASHQRMTIVPADNDLISNCYGYDDNWAQSLRGDLYPGCNGTTELTSYAAYTGGTFGVTIDNIKETADGRIYVDINGGAPRLHAVTYILDGEEYYVDTVAYDSLFAVLPAPERENLEFDGWTGLPADNIMPDNDITITGSFSIPADISEISLRDADDEVITQIYTLDGRRISSLQQGINIVRTNKGKIRKIIVGN